MSKTGLVKGDSNHSNIYENGLANMVTKLGAGLGFTNMINSSNSGDTAEDMDVSFAVDFIAHNPRCGFIAPGTNDMAWAYENNKSQDELLDFYVPPIISMIKKAKSANIPINVISPIPTLIDVQNRRWPDIIKIVEARCKALGVSYIDVYSYFSAMSDSALAALFRDGLYHFNADGHNLWPIPILKTQFSAAMFENDPAGPNLAEVGTILSATFNSNFGNISGSTIRPYADISCFTIPPNPVNWMRVRFKAASDETLLLSKARIGQHTSGVSASSLYELKVGGSSTINISTVDGNVWSDWFQFPWNKTSGLIWPCYTNGPSTSDKIAANNNFTGAATALKAGDEADALAPTGFNNYVGYLSLIDRIETDGF